MGIEEKNMGFLLTQLETGLYLWRILPQEATILLAAPIVFLAFLGAATIYAAK
jgi:hypothetical protein